jgi:hypothetical protein
MRKRSSAFLAIDSVVGILFSALCAKHKGFSGNDTGTRSSNKKAAGRPAANWRRERTHVSNF